MFHRDAMTTAAGKHRRTARRRKGSARAFLLALILGASLLAAACGGGGGGSSDPPPPATLVSITVTPDNLSVFPGAAWAFIATGNFSDGSKRSLADLVIWQTSDPNIVSVDSLGKALTGGALGPATITATSGAFVDTATATVMPACDVTGRSTTKTVPGLVPFSTLDDAVFIFPVVIPEASVAIGIILQSAATDPPDFVIIEHLGAVTVQGGSITGPGGVVVPLSLNQFDFNGDGNETNDFLGLINEQAEALFFPNGGATANLPSGKYSFPTAATVDLENFAALTLTPTVFYKTAAPGTEPVMNVNLYVINGVGGPDFLDNTEAGNDPVIAGAIKALENVYKSQVCLTLNVNVQLIDDPARLDIDSQPEQFALLSGSPYPGGTLDALNLFIVGQLAYLDTPTSNVLGVSAGVPGPFNIQGTVVSGTLAEYIDDSASPTPGAALGFILVHEFGHFLGLFHTSQTNSFQTAIKGHDPIADTPECTTGDLNAGLDSCPDRSNFMFPVIDNNASPPISKEQAIVIKLNPAVSAP